MATAGENTSSKSSARISAKIHSAEPSATSAEPPAEVSATSPSPSAPAGDSAPANANSPQQSGGAGSGAGATTEQPLQARIAEKLAATRGDRKARVEAQRRSEAARAAQQEAERARKAADDERDAAAKERARFADLGKNGSIVDGLKAAGRDPTEAFQQLRDEAIRAGTPEAMIAALTSRFEKELAATKKALEDERGERQKREAQERQLSSRASYERDFASALEDAAHAPLRVFYGDERLLAMADNLLRAPNRIEIATALGVRLTDPKRGLTMKDIFAVLNASHMEDEKGREGRRAAQGATTASPDAPKQAPTTGRKTSATPAPANRNGGPASIGNQLATSSANGGSPPGKGSTSSARINDRVRRYGS